LLGTLLRSHLFVLIGGFKLTSSVGKKICFCFRFWFWFCPSIRTPSLQNRLKTIENKLSSFKYQQSVMIAISKIFIKFKFWFFLLLLYLLPMKCLFWKNLWTKKSLNEETMTRFFLVGKARLFDLQEMSITLLDN